MATKSESKKTYYFARTARQAAVLWNPERKGPWAEFDKWGLFATTDKVVAQAVLDAGYLQVTIDEIKERNLPIPTGESPTQNYQPGAPGRGYQQTGGQPATAFPAPDDGEGPIAFTSNEFPPGPELPKPGEKRTLR